MPLQTQAQPVDCVAEAQGERILLTQQQVVGTGGRILVPLTGQTPPRDPATPTERERGFHQWHFI